METKEMITLFHGEKRKKRSLGNIRRMWGGFVVLCVLFVCFFTKGITTYGDENGNLTESVENSVSDNAIDTEIIADETDIEVVSETADSSTEPGTLGIHFVDQNGWQIENTTYYIDGIPYPSKGILVVKVNPDDRSVHTVYAVAEGYAKSGTQTFSFVGMGSSVLVLFPGTEDSSNISYVIGVIDIIDPLTDGKIHMKDGTWYDWDRDAMADVVLNEWIGKTVICTLKAGVVIAIDEYSQTTDSESANVPTNTYTKQYGKEQQPLTREDKVYKAAKEYNEAMSGYFQSLGQTAQNRLKKTNSTSQSKGKELRLLDEAKGAERILTADMSMPSAAVDSAYEALSDFLDKYTQTGIDLGKIDVSKEMVEIDAGIVNKIVNNVDFNGIPRRKYGNYYVEISATSIWGSFTGRITVQGKGKTYLCVINSSPKEVAQTMEDYLNEISELTKDLEKQALQSIVDEFIDTSYIGAITKSDIKKLFKKQSGYIKKYGFGEDVIDISNNLLEDYNVGKDILELSNMDGFDDAMVNARTIHKTLEAKDYTFEDEFNTGEGDSCPLIEAAVKYLDKTRGNFINALADYLYNTDSYKQEENNSGWDSFVKIFVNCPVDFEIYNQSGGRMAYYKDGVKSEDTSSVRIEVIGDRKVIYIDSATTNVNDIKLTAVDNGTMDYIVENVVDNAVVGRANYYDISLNEGDTFTQNAQWQNASSLTSQNPLMASTGAEILADEYMAVTDNAVVDISCTAGEGGTVRGDGQYIKGETVTLSAMAKDGYQFTGWYVDNELVSVNPTYSFTASKSISVNGTFGVTEIIHPDYKAAIGREYRDFAGVFVYQNKQQPSNADIELRLEGTENTSDNNIFKVKGYLQDNIVLEKTFTVDSQDTSRIRLENVDFKNSEYIEICDSKDILVAYLVHIPGYRNLEDLVIRENTVLQQDVYCDNLEVYSDLDLNGHNLIVAGEVSGEHDFNLSDKEVGTILDVTTVNINDAKMCVVGNINASIDINLNHGKLLEFGDMYLYRGGLNLKQEDDKVSVCGDAEYPRSDGTISAGIMEYAGDVSLASQMKVSGTNKVVFEGLGQQVITGYFNDVYFANDNLVETSHFHVNKLLSNGKIKLSYNDSDNFYVGDFNGYSLVVDGDVKLADTIDLSTGTLVVQGNLFGGTRYDRYDEPSRYYNEAILIINDGKCYVSGDFLGACIQMQNEDGLLDVEGDFNCCNYDFEYNSDSEFILSAGTIRLAGDFVSDGLICTGTHKFIFDGNTEQSFYGFLDTIFNDVEFNNGNILNVKGDSGFGFKNLQSDLNLNVASGGSITLDSEYKFYGEMTEESIPFTSSLNGHTLTINGEVSFGVAYNDTKVYLDLCGGTLEIEGDVEEFYGLIDVNKGQLIFNGDLSLDTDSTENGGLIILDEDEDLVEIHGEFYVGSGYQATYSIDNRTYSASPITDDILPAISAGTIKFWDNCIFRGKELLKFTGTNKVVFCGTGKQLLDSPYGWNLNAVKFENNDVGWDSSDIISIGKLLNDAQISATSLNNINLNGHELQVNRNVYLGASAEEKVDVVNGTLRINGDFYNNGDLTISNVILEVNGDFENDYSYERVSSVNVTNNSTIHVLGDYIDSKRSLTLETDYDVLDVDGGFYYSSSDGLEKGTIKIAGDVLFDFYTTSPFDAGEEEKFVVGANVILDGTEHQSVTFYEKNSKFNKLTITQPISNYTFSPEKCWNTLLDIDGNVLNLSNNTNTNDDNPESPTNPTDPTKPTDPTPPQSSTTQTGTEEPGDATESNVSDKVGDRKIINNAEYKVTNVEKGTSTVMYIQNENKKATTVKVPDTININGINYKVTAIEKNALKNNKKVTKVTIGKNVTDIGANAFYGCTKLKDVTIGGNVKTIGDKAFYKCTALTKITIPSKVNKIGKQAFYNCKKLKTITIKTAKLTNKNVGSKAFKGVYSKATIKVPKSKLNAYKGILKKKGIGKKVKVKK